MDVMAWLRDLGLDRYETAFRDNEIDWEVLPELSEADLEKLGLPLGPRKKLLKAIAALSAERSSASPAAGAEAERRQLTVLFCDLVGSTELSGRLDPEDLSEVMRAYQGCCAEVIGRFSGYVAKYLGDGVLAYFGYPQAHEDDAERAVRAGLGLVAAVTQLRPGHDLALQVRVGIATGLVVVGEKIGTGAAQEETVVGETPNLAARLQAEAGPNSVVIATSTRRLLGGLFECSDLGERRLKGFSARVGVWQVLGEGAAASRFEARRTAGLTPFVGREPELERLLDCWRKAKRSEGQVVLVSGEPGIGKSRLAQTLRGVLDERHTRLSYHGSPFYRDSALHPVIDQLERAAGLTRDDRPEQRLSKLEALLAQSALDVDAAMPLIAALLSIPTGDRYPLLAMTPQRRKDETLQTLLTQLAGLAAREPVLMMFEDAHWIDPTSIELLGLAIELVRRLPVLVVITFRPEFVPPWTGQPHVTSLLLERLSRRQGAKMVARLTDGRALPTAIFEQIVVRTDGVPLFVEELTKMALESGLLTDQGDHYELAGPLPPLGIPATLHDSLMARLDRLASVKEVAQIGAAIGREFSYELLATVAPVKERELLAALDQLARAGLLFRKDTPDQPQTYTFKHALVQEGRAV